MVEQHVDILHKARVTIDACACGAENGNALVVVMKVALESFTFKVNLLFRLLKLLVFAHDAAANVAQFGVWKSNVVVVHQSAVGRQHKVAQSRHRLSKTVRNIDEQHQCYGKQHQHKPQKHIVRLHESLHCGIVGHCHTHNVTIESLGVVKVFAVVGLRQTYIATLLILQCGLHLGSCQVVVHFVNAVVCRFKFHTSYAADNGQSQVGRHHTQHVGVAHRVTTIFVLVNRFAHHVGIAPQA